MNNITKPSRRFALLFKMIFYAYPVAVLGLWLLVDPTGTDGWITFDMIDAGMAQYGITKIMTWQRLACFGASMLTGSAVMYVFHKLAKLFNAYAAGIFFEAVNVACYRAIGVGLIIQQVFSLPEEALLTTFLSWNNPEGERFVSLTFDDANISMIVVGLMVILISRIMDEGRKMQEEQQYTI